MDLKRVKDQITTKGGKEIHMKTKKLRVSKIRAVSRAVHTHGLLRGDAVVTGTRSG